MLMMYDVGSCSMPISKAIAKPKSSEAFKQIDQFHQGFNPYPPPLSPLLRKVRGQNKGLFLGFEPGTSRTTKHGPPMALHSSIAARGFVPI